MSSSTLACQCELGSAQYQLKERDQTEHERGSEQLCIVTFLHVRCAYLGAVGILEHRVERICAFVTGARGRARKFGDAGVS